MRSLPAGAQSVLDEESGHVVDPRSKWVRKQDPLVAVRAATMQPMDVQDPSEMLAQAWQHVSLPRFRLAHSKPPQRLMTMTGHSKGQASDSPPSSKTSSSSTGQAFMQGWRDGSRSREPAAPTVACGQRSPPRRLLSIPGLCSRGPARQPQPAQPPEASTAAAFAQCARRNSKLQEQVPSASHPESARLPPTTRHAAGAQG
jgi:hypothetical protein